MKIVSAISISYPRHPPQPPVPSFPAASLFIDDSAAEFHAD